MALPELTKKQIEKTLTAYCKAKVPANLKHKVRVGFKLRGNTVTLYEERPAFGKPDTWVDIVVMKKRTNIVIEEELAEAGMKVTGIKTRSRLYDSGCMYRE